MNDDNLPIGTANRSDAPWNELPEMDCELCSGSGNVVLSCCTGDVVNNDYAVCPECKEHLGEESCDLCDGTGKVPMSREDYNELRKSKYESI